MRLAACVLGVLTGLCHAESLTPRMRVASHGEIRGAAVAPDGRLFTWGDSLSVRANGTGKARVLAKGHFGEGGCLVDLDGDGQVEFVGKEGAGLGPLTWRKPPSWKPNVLEAATDTHDCVEATLFGRRGVLAIHRHTQVRFYEPGKAGQPWTVRDIYSIYTPSHQGGLSLDDIDGDGRLDILCGNYWIRSPASFDRPWHLFALNTWFELPPSAMHAHAVTPDGFFAAQAHMAPARVALFQRTSDVRQLWTESRIPGDFRRVHAVVLVEGRVLFAENDGPGSRIFAVHNGRAAQLASGDGTLKLFAAPGGVLSVGRRAITLWHYRRK